MAVVKRSARADSPITLLGIRNAIDRHPARIFQTNLLTRIAQPPGVRANNVGYRRVLRLKHCHVGGDNQIPAAIDRHVAKRVIDSRVDPPAAEVDRRNSRIVKLDPLVTLVPRLSVIHDLVDQDLARQHLPRFQRLGRPKPGEIAPLAIVSSRIEASAMRQPSPQTLGGRNQSIFTRHACTVPRAFRALEGSDAGPAGPCRRLGQRNRRPTRPWPRQSRSLASSGPPTPRQKCLFECRP